MVRKGILIYHRGGVYEIASVYFDAVSDILTKERA
jgi:hypothetical protein